MNTKLNMKKESKGWYSITVNGTVYSIQQGDQGWWVFKDNQEFSCPFETLREAKADLVRYLEED